MTPTAREELRRFCQDAAKARKAKEAWSFADLTDAAVALGCVVGLVFFAGWEARRHYEASQRAEPKVRLVHRIEPFPPLIDCTQHGREEYARTCRHRAYSTLIGAGK